MPSMTYCIFQNTVTQLLEATRHLDGLMDEYGSLEDIASSELSKDENEALMTLIHTIPKIAEMVDDEQ